MNNGFVETGLSRRVAEWVRHGDPTILLLYGPAGSGKTVTVRHVAAQCGRPVFWVSATRGTNLELLFGLWTLRPTPNGTETFFEEGILLRGLLTPGALLVLDDAHLVAPDLQILNGLGDSSRELTVPARGRTCPIAEGVCLVLIANPPPRTVASWERERWLIPEQIRDRARVIQTFDALTLDEEFAIARLYFPEDCPDEIVRGVVELARNLRSNSVLSSYAPSLRSVVILGKLMRQGLGLGEAYLEAIAYKFDGSDEFAVAIEAFVAKFGMDPREKKGG